MALHQQRCGQDSVFYISILLKHSALWATRTVWRNIYCSQSMWSPLHALVLFCHSILTLIFVCRCESCGAVFHSECKVKAVPCPRCVRKELQKKQKSFWRRLNMDENFEESCNMFELSYQNTWVPQGGGQPDKNPFPSCQLKQLLSQAEIFLQNNIWPSSSVNSSCQSVHKALLALKYQWLNCVLRWSPATSSHTKCGLLEML